MLPWILCAFSLAQSAPPPPAAVQAHLKSAPGEVWFYAKNLKTGKTLEWRADERVRTASTIKLPIMAVVFSEVTAGRLKWEQPVTLRAEDKVSGSGVLTEFSPGTALALRDLVHLMIVVSDNTATNLVLDRLTADRVNECMESWGFKETRSLRKVRGDGTKLKEAAGWSRDGLRPELQRYGLGVSTSREMVRLLEMLNAGKVVTEAASREMVEILKRQQYKDAIGRKTGNLDVASKSGSLDRLRSDVGIVFTPAGPVAMAMTVDGLPATDYSPDNPALPWMGELAQRLLAELGR